MKLLSLLLLLFTVACSAPVDGAGRAPGVVPPEFDTQAAELAAVTVHTIETGCGGIALAPRLVLTARHCFWTDAKVPTAIVKSWDGTATRGLVYYMADEWAVDTDVAFVEIPEAAPALNYIAPVGLREPVEGEWLAQARPLNGGEHIVGQFSWSTPYLYGNTYEPGMQYAISARQGDSGSPVFGTDGAVVGVVSACADGDPVTACKGIVIGVPVR